MTTGKKWPGGLWVFVAAGLACLPAGGRGEARAAGMCEAPDSGGGAGFWGSPSPTTIKTTGVFPERSAFPTSPAEKTPSPFVDVRQPAEAVRQTAAFVPAAPAGGAAASAALDAVDGTLDSFDIDDAQVSMFKDVYDAISPYFTSGEYRAIMNRVDGRWPNRIWVPRKASTAIGSLQRVADAWGNVENAAVLARIGSIMARGGLEEKKTSEIIDDLVASGIGTANQYGEAAYWAVAIGTGMYNGRSFSEAVGDAFDPETAGTWSKIGWGMGYWTAEAVGRLEKWMNRNERRNVEERMLANLAAAGYGKEAEEALRRWFALDDAIRARTPFVLKDEWKTENRREDKGKKRRRKAGRPCMSCMFGDLGGTCSTPECPNYGHPHTEYRP